jgi:predicted TIM-barrel fold metal-dependent hydrolase
MPLNLAAIPILDHHCHAFLRDQWFFDSVQFQRFFTESASEVVRREHVPHTVFFKWAVKELAAFLGCEPTVAAVLSARTAVPAWTLARRMFEDANIRLLLVDYGFQGAENVTWQEMRDLVPIRIEPMLRLEVLAQQLIVEHDTFDDMLDAYTAAVAGARAGGHVALKSIIAYRTGLAIRPTERAAAAAAFAAAKQRAQAAGSVRLADKPLNDYLVLAALAVAEEQQLPVQFHTGFGDSDLDMLLANPFHLRPVLESGRFDHVPFVLLHASYPYVRELGYLAAIYPNVYMDVGLAVPYVTIDIPALWRQALGLTPISKILFSTDAYSMPEIYWLAARWGRWGLGVVLEELCAIGALTAEEAEDAAVRILHANSEELYGVKL